MINEVYKFVNANKELTLSKRVPWTLIMDTCPMTRNGLRAILKRAQFMTGEVMMLNKASDIPLCLASDLPDVVIMDLCGDGESVLEGLRIIATCKKDWPLIPIVVCTALTDIRFLQQVKLLKVSAICYKHDPLQSIEDSIFHARHGTSQDSSTVQRMLKEERNTPATLTKKEMDTLIYLLAGCSVSDMSKILNRDIRTISSHKCNAMVKLGYRNNSELFTRGRWMFKNGLYNVEDAKKI